MVWYIVRKKGTKRWYSCEVGSKPKLRKGYEMKGPYKNLVQCLIAANPMLRGEF